MGAKVVPLGAFSFTDDQTTGASDLIMRYVFGKDWQNLTFGQLAEELNSLLKPFGQALEFVKGEGWLRHVDHPTDAIAVWTNIRQTAQYVYNLSH